MIRLTAMLARNPALSPAVFESHWRTTHAELMRSLPRIDEYVVRYEQHPRLVADGRWTGSEGFDGVAVQWFRDLESLEAMVADPDYRHLVVPDERYLLDLPGSAFLITSEPRVIIGP